MLRGFRRWLANPFGFAPSGSTPGTLSTLDLTQVGLFVTALYGALEALAPVIPGGPEILRVVTTLVPLTTAAVALWHRFRGDNKAPA